VTEKTNYNKRGMMMMTRLALFAIIVAVTYGQSLGEQKKKKKKRKEKKTKKAKER
jgi:hypothetical protein